ncbi:hypothetical protein Tco_0221410 [Tanacetum coccineum]
MDRLGVWVHKILAVKKLKECQGYVLVDFLSVSFDVVDESYGPSDTALIALTEEIIAYIHESDVTQAAKGIMCSE